MSKRYQLHHRAVAEEAAGRCLREDEVVHHVNLDTSDNRPENLAIMTSKQHNALHGQLHAYLPMLISAGFLKFDPARKRYLPADILNMDPAAMPPGAMNQREEYAIIKTVGRRLNTDGKGADFYEFMEAVAEFDIPPARFQKRMERLFKNGEAYKTKAGAVKFLEDSQ